jgi:hypothetical protein
MEGELPLIAREGLKIRGEGEISGKFVGGQDVIVARRR